MMGKYLNGYQARQGKPGGPGYQLPTPMPPGWTSWAVTDNGYQQYNYTLNLDGRALEPHYGRTPANFLTDVLSDKGAGFITRSARAHKPFMLELAPFSPHSAVRGPDRGTAAPADRDRGRFPGLKAPRGPAFDTANVDPPAWLAAQRAALTPAQSRISTRSTRGAPRRCSPSTA